MCLEVVCVCCVLSMVKDILVDEKINMTAETWAGPAFQRMRRKVCEENVWAEVVVMLYLHPV